MKYSINVLLFVFSSIIISNNCYSQQTIAYYNFNNSLQDLSGNNNHGKGFGAISFSTDRFGNNCSALSLNGNDAYIEVVHSDIFNKIKKEFSVTCWFKLKSNYANNGRWLTILCKGDNSIESLNNPHFRVQTYQGEKQSTVSINTDFTEYDTDFKNHLIDFDKWYFYCLTYDGQNVSVYINEQLIWKFPYNKELIANNSSLYIGKDSPGSMELFNGDFDELRILDYSLPESEVLKIKRSTDVGSYLETFELNCPKNLIVKNTKSECFSKIEYEKPSISTSCLDVKTEQIKGLPSGSNFPVGNTIIAFKATSKGNEIQTCVSNISVIDREAPAFNYVKDTTLVVSENLQSIKYNYPEPKVSDNCKVKKVWLQEGIASGKEFPIGLTKIVYKANDEYGNIDSCVFNVKVIKDNDLALKYDVANKTINTSLGQIYHEHKTLEIDSCIVTIQIYDNGDQDNDSISIFYNSEEIVGKSMLKLKHNGTIIKTINFKNGGVNELVFKAWNTGTTGLNTMKAEFYYGDLSASYNKMKNLTPFATKEFNSKPGLSSGILIKCK